MRDRQRRQILTGHQTIAPAGLHRIHQRLELVLDVASSRFARTQVLRDVNHRTTGRRQAATAECTEK